MASNKKTATTVTRAELQAHLYIRGTSLFRTFRHTELQSPDVEVLQSVNINVNLGDHPLTLSIRKERAMAIILDEPMCEIKEMLNDKSLRTFDSWLLEYRSRIDTILSPEIEVHMREAYYRI